MRYLSCKEKVTIFFKRKSIVLSRSLVFVKRVVWSENLCLRSFNLISCHFVYLSRFHLESLVELSLFYFSTVFFVLDSKSLHFIDDSSLNLSKHVLKGPLFGFFYRTLRKVYEPQCHSKRDDSYPNQIHFPLVEERKGF
jgi:hypothetical protein